MFILAGSALLGHSVRLNDLDRILKLLVKIIILSISFSRYPLLNGENFKTCSFSRQKKKQKISLNDNMMELANICYWPPLAKLLPALLVPEEISKERKKVHIRNRLS